MRRARAAPVSPRLSTCGSPLARRSHVVGYLTIRLKLLPRSTLEGLGAYVATIGLPSVLFVKVANLRSLPPK